MHGHGGRFLTVLPRTRAEDRLFREALPEGVCCPLSAGKAPFRSLHGLPVAEIIGDVGMPEGLRRAVGIAALNALAERFRSQTTVLSQAEIHPRARLKTVGSV